MDLSIGPIHDYAADDKIAHVLGGYCIGATSAALAERLMPHQRPAVRFVVACIPALVAGIAKETYDSHHAHHDADAKDALATTAGGVAGALTINLCLHF